jgi:hypothetical protein
MHKVSKGGKANNKVKSKDTDKPIASVKRAKRTKQIKQGKPVKITLVCILTGEIVKLSRDQVLKQSIKFKFNDVTDFIKSFISKAARAQLVKGISEKQIRESCGNKDLPVVSQGVIRHYVKKIKNTQKAEKIEKRRLAQEFVENGEGAYIVKQNIRKSINFKDPAQVASLTQSACLRPDIYLNNERFCNGCALYELCKCRLKKWNNKIEEPKRKRK